MAPIFTSRTLAFISFLVSRTQALVARTNGPAACLSLTSSLGSAKVVTNQLDTEYVSSREDYWNARQSDYAPSCVVYPESAQDISLALVTIKAAGTRFAIKAGGHNPNNFFSSVDQGVLIDLGSMTAKSYDAATTLATYEPGNNWGDLYGYYQQYGRTVMGGRLSGVGSGLALGGGLSYLSPQYGMACDSFSELEVVLPSGEIITASETSNPELFLLGLRGGGGNAYGVVTKYTVQTRPVGNFYAGNIIYILDETNAVLQAIHDFIVYNTDPKATILATYESLLTPDLTLNLDEAIIMFLVYDGEDPGTAFSNFTDIPYVVNTMAVMTYPEVANLPLPFTAEISRADNIFRVGVHHIEDDSYLAVFQSWRAWAESNKGSYVHTSFDIYPVARSLTDASHAQGGNAMDMPDGPWFWVNYILATPTGLPDDAYDAIQASFREMVESTPSAADLPLFLNEASPDQDPLSTFSTHSVLQQIKETYDPDGFFAEYTGGWSFT